METTRIDDHYLDMMGVEFAYGRNFSKDMPAINKNYIVNEKAMHLMGLDRSRWNRIHAIWEEEGK